MEYKLPTDGNLRDALKEYGHRLRWLVLAALMPLGLLLISIVGYFLFVPGLEQIDSVITGSDLPNLLMVFIGVIYLLFSLAILFFLVFGSYYILRNEFERITKSQEKFPLNLGRDIWFPILIIYNLLFVFGIYFLMAEPEPVRDMSHNNPSNGNGGSYSSAVFIPKLNTGEYAFLLKNPTFIPAIYTSWKMASSQAQMVCGMSYYNDASDAFRHCFGTYILAQKIGYDKALEFTSLHEAFEGNDLYAKEMDLWNNQVGADLSLQHVFVNYEELTEKVLALLEEGKLIVY